MILRVKEIWDDYLTEERNELGYRKIKDDAPEDVRKNIIVF